MLVNATAMLQSAEKGHYGIGAFNTNNLEWASSILDAGEELQSPLIIQCTSGAAKWQTSFKLVADMVKDLVEAKNITVPVALHLDHGSYEAALECIDAGFTSVMYDGSHEKDFETNLAHTAEIVKLAHNKGISVEAEVGGIGGTEDGVTAKGELADPEQCKAIADLGVDFLACGIGNIHGIYPVNWEGLSFDRLQEIKAKTGDLPLVLHGGTGIPVEQVKKAISLGISKINVNTDLQLVFAAATRKYIEEGLDQQGKGYDPRKLLKPGREAIKERTEELIKEFGSDGKGWN
ncbi:class II fructose-1,6-bisphosphate aldolase [Olsenella sp. AF16-14LB]|jgi:fructose-bisphosphate aldolase class II|uniref:class II fructose-1,6-bisphosphate aldolase n=1 Tax=Atopobiaceae TaxID=1643824 RepID=UPI000E4453AA|nr:MULTISPECIES: class II fructose-1,6-bisphosphate aldolase [unclassified Olsenella]RGJ44875.1 class II fructose-1,6-bisphosphate aldolase [Olsenella sp. TM06-36]RGU52637.1 class II fructose-1,6-bisphosphate aldolase [Olsenella sp. AF16-14LB]RGU83878.1 class II fructose-1,6-bisphosphate aldolase [Olsenella sp. AF15-43LB]RHJ90720.1 class II fructose-1,6-bisphosphate aldolase [Olsenella sp. AM05-7]RHJ96549.1 class II fructose-1,6-bisphosphate aldolase [Olsenella sp. AM05-17]